MQQDLDTQSLLSCLDFEVVFAKAGHVINSSFDSKQESASVSHESHRATVSTQILDSHAKRTIIP
jgi:hypothetical protein